MATAVEFQPVLLADPEVEIIGNPVGLNNYFLMRKIHLRRFDFIFHLLIEMNNNKKKIVARISLIVCLSLLLFILSFLPSSLFPLIKRGWERVSTWDHLQMVRYEARLRIGMIKNQQLISNEKDIIIIFMQMQYQIKKVPRFIRGSYCTQRSHAVLTLQHDFKQLM